MTASPSQFGASTTMPPGSDIATLFRFVAHPEIFAGQHLLIAPPPVHPQPECGMPPHVHLEHVGAALREVANGIRRIGSRRIDGMLVDETVASSRQRQREDRYDRCPCTQCERGKRRRGRRGTTKKIDVDGVGCMQML